MRNLLISMALCSGLLLAQGPMGRGTGPRGFMKERGVMGRGMGPGPAGSEALKSYLGLTDAQVEQMRTLRRQRAETVQPESAAMRAKAQELRQLMQSAAPDPAKVGALTVELKQLREKARAGRSGLAVQTRAVLTADQQAKLKDLQAAAKLAPAAMQAMALGLVDPPELGTIGAGAAPMAERMRGGRGRAR